MRFDPVPRPTASAYPPAAPAASEQPPTGHVFRVDRKRGPVWYAKYRLPNGRQVQRKIGPAWSERGRPPAGYFTKRLAAEHNAPSLRQGSVQAGRLTGLSQYI